MIEVIKFPYRVSRRLHSRKPRRSKNGTPEQRAAKAAAEGATVIQLSAGQPRCSTRTATALDLAKVLRNVVKEQLARGRTIDSIFDEIDEGMLKLESR
jgi:hypothetical protein